MLRSLYIENIAVAKRLNLELSHGFTVLTGATGAGKSVMIDSLSVLSGGKFPKEMIRTGENHALVSAVFTDLSHIPALKDAGVEADENGEVEIQRMLTPDGRSTVKINRRSVPLSVLKEISPAVLGILSQNESRNLEDKAYHINMLDSFADAEELLLDYRASYEKLTALYAMAAQLKDSLRQKNMLTDILEYQLKEIDGAKLSDPEEDIKLSALRLKIKNIERIQKYAGFVYHALVQNDKGASTGVLLQKAAAALRQLADVMPEAEEMALKLESYRFEIDDIGESAYALMNDGEITNPDAQLNAIETRLSLIERLKRKYGETIADILAFRGDAAKKLSELTSGEEKIAEIEGKIVEIRKILAEKTSKLNEARHRAGEKLAESVSKTLSYLDIPKVRFVVDVRRLFDAAGQEQFGPKGSDDVTFLIATNPGEPPMPLGKIASGGELSRVMLALNCVLNTKSGATTLVFDEVDAGVSGGTSEKIGIKLKELSKSVQVIAVTHSPQIASLADTHLLIKKSDESGRAESTVELLDADGRVAEIARIIGGISITETQRDAAREMITNNAESDTN